MCYPHASAVPTSPHKDDEDASEHGDAGADDTITTGHADRRESPVILLVLEELAIACGKVWNNGTVNIYRLQIHCPCLSTLAIDNRPSGTR